jgi:hypothetical protein
MVTNGTLQYKLITGGGIDGNGDPVQAVETWSNPIDCLIHQNTNGRLMKYQDGQYVAASHSINVELGLFNSTAIRITNNQGMFVGEFQVLPQNIYKYSFVTRIKITV